MDYRHLNWNNPCWDQQANFQDQGWQHCNRFAFEPRYNADPNLHCRYSNEPRFDETRRMERVQLVAANEGRIPQCDMIPSVFEIDRIDPVFGRNPQMDRMQQWDRQTQMDRIPRMDRIPNYHPNWPEISSREEHYEDIRCIGPSEPPLSRPLFNVHPRRTLEENRRPKRRARHHLDDVYLPNYDDNPPRREVSQNPARVRSNWNSRFRSTVVGHAKKGSSKCTSKETFRQKNQNPPSSTSTSSSKDNKISKDDEKKENVTKNSEVTNSSDGISNMLSASIEYQSPEISSSSENDKLSDVPPKEESIAIHCDQSLISECTDDKNRQQDEKCLIGEEELNSNSTVVNMELESDTETVCLDECDHVVPSNTVKTSDNTITNNDNSPCKPLISSNITHSVELGHRALNLDKPAISQESLKPPKSDKSVKNDIRDPRLISEKSSVPLLTSSSSKNTINDNSPCLPIISSNDTHSVELGQVALNPDKPEISPESLLPPKSDKCVKNDTRDPRLSSEKCSIPFLTSSSSKNKLEVTALPSGRYRRGCFNPKHSTFFKILKSSDLSDPRLSIEKNNSPDIISDLPVLKWQEETEQKSEANNITDIISDKACHKENKYKPILSNNKLGIAQSYRRDFNPKQNCTNISNYKKHVPRLSKLKGKTDRKRQSLDKQGIKKYVGLLQNLRESKTKNIFQRGPRHIIKNRKIVCQKNNYELRKYRTFYEITQPLSDLCCHVMIHHNECDIPTESESCLNLLDSIDTKRSYLPALNRKLGQVQNPIRKVSENVTDIRSLKEKETANRLETSLSKDFKDEASQELEFLAKRVKESSDCVEKTEKIDITVEKVISEKKPSPMDKGSKSVKYTKHEVRMSKFISFREEFSKFNKPVPDLNDEFQAKVVYSTPVTTFDGVVKKKSLDASCGTSNESSRVGKLPSRVTKILHRRKSIAVPSEIVVCRKEIPAPVKEVVIEKERIVSDDKLTELFGDDLSDLKLEQEKGSKRKSTEQEKGSAKKVKEAFVLKKKNAKASKRRGSVTCDVFEIQPKKISKRRSTVSSSSFETIDILENNKVVSEKNSEFTGHVGINIRKKNNEKELTTPSKPSSESVSETLQLISAEISMTSEVIFTQQVEMTAENSSEDILRILDESQISLIESENTENSSKIITSTSVDNAQKISDNVTQEISGGVAVRNCSNRIQNQKNQDTVDISKIREVSEKVSSAQLTVVNVDEFSEITQIPRDFLENTIEISNFTSSTYFALPDSLPEHNGENVKTLPSASIEYQRADSRVVEEELTESASSEQDAHIIEPYIDLTEEDENRDSFSNVIITNVRTDIATQKVIKSEPDEEEIIVQMRIGENPLNDKEVKQEMINMYDAACEVKQEEVEETSECAELSLKYSVITKLEDKFWEDVGDIIEEAAFEQVSASTSIVPERELGTAEQNCSEIFMPVQKEQVLVNNKQSEDVACTKRLSPNRIQVDPALSQAHATPPNTQYNFGLQSTTTEKLPPIHQDPQVCNQADLCHNFKCSVLEILKGYIPLHRAYHMAYQMIAETFQKYQSPLNNINDERDSIKGILRERQVYYGWFLLMAVKKLPIDLAGFNLEMFVRFLFDSLHKAQLTTGLLNLLEYLLTLIMLYENSYSRYDTATKFKKMIELLYVNVTKRAAPPQADPVITEKQIHTAKAQIERYLQLTKNVPNNSTHGEQLPQLIPVGQDLSLANSQAGQRPNIVVPMPPSAPIVGSPQQIVHQRRTSINQAVITTQAPTTSFVISVKAPNYSMLNQSGVQKTNTYSVSQPYQNVYQGNLCQQKIPSGTQQTNPVPNYHQKPEYSIMKPSPPQNPISQQHLGSGWIPSVPSNINITGPPNRQHSYGSPSVQYPNNIVLSTGTTNSTHSYLPMTQMPVRDTLIGPVANGRHPEVTPTSLPSRNIISSLEKSPTAMLSQVNHKKIPQCSPMRRSSETGTTSQIISSLEKCATAMLSQVNRMDIPQCSPVRRSSEAVTTTKSSLERYSPAMLSQVEEKCTSSPGRRSSETGTTNKSISSEKSTSAIVTPYNNKDILRKIPVRRFSATESTGTIIASSEKSTPVAVPQCSPIRQTNELPNLEIQRGLHLQQQQDVLPRFPKNRSNAIDIRIMPEVPIISSENSGLCKNDFNASKPASSSSICGTDNPLSFSRNTANEIILRSLLSSSEPIKDSQKEGSSTPRTDIRSPVIVQDSSSTSIQEVPFHDKRIRQNDVSLASQNILNSGLKSKTRSSSTESKLDEKYQMITSSIDLAGGVVDIKQEDEQQASDNEIIDLTWMDDFTEKELAEGSLQDEFLYVKVESLEENSVPPLSSCDSGIESPPIKMEYPELILDNRLCLCGKTAVYLCNCNTVMYCSQKCQFTDWSKHKKVCS